MKKQRVLVVSMAIGLTVLLVGCGKSDADPAPAASTASTTTTTTPTTNGVSCGAGLMRIGPTCVQATSFEQACSMVMGTMITSNGIRMCRMQLLPTNAPWGFFNLDPSDPSGPYAFDTGIQVHAGDKLQFSSSGGWGGQAKVVEFLGIDLPSWLQPTTVNCNLVSVDGLRDGSQVFNNGSLAGMWGTDGTETFFLGRSKSLVFNNQGSFKIGFNAPSEASCFTASWNLKVMHCEDAAGTTYRCP